jgi:hypothetical protein
MSDCPLLTKKDMEIFSEKIDLINQIAVLSDDVLKLPLGECDIKTGGGYREEILTAMLYPMLTFIVYAVSKGGTTALLNYALKEEWILTLSLMLLKLSDAYPNASTVLMGIHKLFPVLTPCETIGDQVWAAIGSTYHVALTCSQRARLFEESVNMITDLIGLTSGGAALSVAIAIKIRRLARTLASSNREDAAQALLELNAPVSQEEEEEFHDAVSEGGARGRRRKNHKNRKTKRGGRRRQHKSRKH